MSSRTLLTATLISCVALQACTQAPDMAKVQADVAKAQADGQKMIVDAQANSGQSSMRRTTRTSSTRKRSSQ